MSPPSFGCRFLVRVAFTCIQAAFASLSGCATEGTVSLMETRHYYIDVKHCELDLLIRERGSTYKSGKGKSTLLKSWSMRYTKTRRYHSAWRRS